MNLRAPTTLLLTVASLTPLAVQAAVAADSCNSKLIRTSYQRISPRTVKETKIFEKTRLISKAAPARRFAQKSTRVYRTAYLAPRTHTYTTTTRTTSMFFPTSSLVAPVAIMKPVAVAPATTVIRQSAIVPNTTVIRESAIVPNTTVVRSAIIPNTTIIRASEIVPTTTVVRAASIEPSCKMVGVQSVVSPVLSSTSMIAAPGDTVVFKEKHGKLKQIGTLKPVVWY